jgi:hypothetical protein
MGFYVFDVVIMLSYCFPLMGFGFIVLFLLHKMITCKERPATNARVLQLEIFIKLDFFLGEHVHLATFIVFSSCACTTNEVHVCLGLGHQIVKLNYSCFIGFWCQGTK